MGLNKKCIAMALLASLFGCVDPEVSDDDFDSLNIKVLTNENSIVTLLETIADLEAEIEELKADDEALSGQLDTLDIQLDAVLESNLSTAEAVVGVQLEQVTIREDINNSFTSMHNAFPDAIELGESDTNRQVFYILNSGEHSEAVTYWHPQGPDDQEPNTITFNTSRAFAECSGSGCNGEGTSIAVLTALGNTFNFTQSELSSN